MRNQFTTLFKFIIVLLLVVSCWSLVGTSVAQAQGLPFGGIVSSRFSCTCSGTTWIWFTPLYLGGPVVATGALVYSPFSTILYANLNIGVSGKWHLGDYLPGVQACWIRVWKFCLPLPSLGLMTKVGTN